MRDLYFVSGNKNNYLEIVEILNSPIKHLFFEIPEIQSEDIYKIAKEKVQSAYQILKKPVVVEEVALYLECLNKFPGPLIKFLVSSIGAEGISNLVKNYNEKNAVARCVISYFDGKNFKFFTGDVNGRIVLMKGKENFGFDSIFKPSGKVKTFGEMRVDEKNKISHRFIAWKKFEEFLKKN